MLSSRVEELEAAIREQPDDVALRAVHADALLERGATGDRQRGQLIQLALAGELGDQTAANTARELQRKARARLVKKLDKDFVLRLGWRHGSVESIAIETRGWGSRKLLILSTVGRLVDLFDAPEVFALRSLDTRGAGETHVETVISLVKHLPIRWLGIIDPVIGGHQLDLLHGLPQLDGAGLGANDRRALLAALRDRPWLVDLEISDHDDVAAEVIEICPQLTRLVLYRVRQLAPLAPVLERRALLRLRDLGVMALSGPTGELVRRLAGSPLLPALRSFGCCAASLYDEAEHRTWFVANRAAFAHVRLFAGTFDEGGNTGHEAGRLGMLLDELDRDAEAIEDQWHHLEHSGHEQVHAGCWARLANHLIQVDHYSEALRAVDRGIAVMGDPPNNGAYLWRTRLHALDYLDRYAEGLIASDRALELDGDCSWTWRYRGAALRETGRLDEAAAAFDRAIELSEEGSSYRSWAYLLRGELRKGRRQLDDAIADLAHAIELAGDDAAVRRRARLALGTIAYWRGDLAGARPHFVDALSQSSRDDHDAISALGATLFELGEHQLAFTTWQIAALQFSWNDIDEQGHALIALGRPADALTTLAAGREVGGARAMALHALGRTDEAIAALDRLAFKPHLEEPACAARLALGSVLQALLMRAAGRPRDATKLLAKLRGLPHAPTELHAALLRKLRGHDTSQCCAAACERPAAAALIAAALARGDTGEATRRARVLGAWIDDHLAQHIPAIEWDLRSIHQLAPSPLLASVIAAVERYAKVG